MNDPMRQLPIVPNCDQTSSPRPVCAWCKHVRYLIGKADFGRKIGSNGAECTRCVVKVHKTKKIQELANPIYGNQRQSRYGDMSNHPRCWDKNENAECKDYEPTLWTKLFFWWRK